MFVDKNGNRYPYIFLFEKETEDYLAGWYFADECEQLHGPFSTFEETKELYENYMKDLK